MIGLSMDSLYFVVPAILLLFAILIAVLAFCQSVSLSTKSYPRWRKTTERIALAFVALLAVAAAAISTYNAIAIEVFRATNPPLGKLYPINGRKMHLYCIGTGDPTIILEPGLGTATDVLSWNPFQTKLAASTRVCSYGRAGVGWSEPQPGPRDADHIVANLHDVLGQAGINGPLVLLGTSYGGIYIRDYAAHYPDQVVGLVMIDSSTPFQRERFAALAGPAKGPGPTTQLAILHLQYFVGLPRLKGVCGHPVHGVEGRLGRALGEDACIAHYEGVREFLSAAQTSTEAAQAGPFGDLPILILSRDASKVLSMGSTSKERTDREALWNTMQEELKALSSRSRRIIAKGSGHGVTVEREDLAVREVLLFVDQIRGTAPPPTNYRSTIVE